MLKDLKFDNILKFPFSLIAKPRLSFGLDVGTYAIKLICLERNGQVVSLRKIASFNILNSNDLAVPLSDFVKSQKLEGLSVNISLSGFTVLTHYIAFPAMSLSELKSTMQFEAKDYIPFPLEGLILDYAILKEKLPDNKMLVLLAAAKKAEIGERLSLLEKCGLRLELIDADCFCLVNAFTANPQSESGVIGILNIGHKFTNMAIIENGILRFSRDIALGGEDVTRAVCEALGVTPEEARIIKTDPDKLKEVLYKVEPVINSLCLETRLSMDYYENQNGQAVEKLFLCGGTSNLSGITAHFAQVFGMPVAILDPFSGIDYSQVAASEDLEKNRNSFAIACGLALRGL